MTVLVFGARGRVATEVIEGVLGAGESVRAASGHPDRLTVPSGVDVVRGDVRQPVVLAEALRGVGAVFLYAEPDGIDDVVAALGDAGVKHVVLLSSAAVAQLEDGSRPAEVGAASDPLGWRHLTVERALAASGIAWTFLRPGAFATNTLPWAPGIRAEGTVRVARPDAQNSPIHERDIAEVAVRALLDPGHDSARYLLTGPESLSQRRQVDIIAETIGRPLRLVELSDDEARRRLARWATPAVADRVVAGLIARDGKPAPVQDTVHRVLGRPARTFADWARDHAADFR